MLKKFPSDKINGTKNALFFLYAGLEKLRPRCRSGALGRAKPLRTARFFGCTPFA